MSKKTKQPEVEAGAEAPVAPPTGFPLFFIGMGGFALLIIAFAVTTALIQQRPKEPLKLAPEALKPAPAAKPEPAPWTYDSVTNQHWDPAHKHWHAGPPPNQGHAGVAPQSAPDIPNPAPWQYDEATNQFFDPEHGHWHKGRPPADKVAAPPAPGDAAQPAPEVPAPLTVEEAATTPQEPAPAPVAVEEAATAPAQ